MKGTKPSAVSQHLLWDLETQISLNLSSWITILKLVLYSTGFPFPENVMMLGQEPDIISNILPFTQLFSQHPISTQKLICVHVLHLIYAVRIT